MPRILIGLAPIILIVAVCSWFVRVEGQLYRQRLRESAGPARETLGSEDGSSKA